MGVHAVHPGYGFLSENSDFAKAVEDAGIEFIGPTPEQMKQFGDKIEARKLAVRTNTPLITGTKENLTDSQIREKAEEIGYPLLIKASAGGGGRGIRLVESADQITEQLANARKEAKLAFNDDRVYLEKFIANGRHVEVQILGDGNGEVFHFGERDCTMQRKNQKLIEESPAPTITREKADEIHEAALRLTSGVDYRNAGTVEFLLDNNTHDFFFLEVNARIQVEHPVTEFVTGEDLIWRQIQVSAGEEMGISQDNIHLKGHAIEARIYAENPFKDFAPSPGKINRIRHPIGNGVRVDSAMEDGSVITPFYDPMISKLIVYAPDRQAATRKLQKTLDYYLISGVHTTAAYIRQLVKNPDFINHNYHTKYLEDHSQEVPEVLLNIARAVAGRSFQTGGHDQHMIKEGDSISKWRTSTWPRYRR
jgi:acetyl-CoA carboxylase biotin carboxylase subunit